MGLITNLLNIHVLLVGNIFYLFLISLKLQNSFYLIYKNSNAHNKYPLIKYGVKIFIQLLKLVDYIPNYICSYLYMLYMYLSYFFLNLKHLIILFSGLFLPYFDNHLSTTTIVS